MGEIVVVPIERIELKLAPQPWLFATAREAEIRAHFSALKRVRPALHNGRVLLLGDYAIEGGHLSGTCFATDFASFLAWRDWGFPDPAVKNFFAMGALRSSDGAFLLGVMAPHTANAGRVYFPAGTPEPADLRFGMVDLAGSLRRELAEETGLALDDLVVDFKWHAILSGPQLALIRLLRAAVDAHALRERILAELAGQRQPEFADVRIVRGPADFDPMMPPFVTAFLAWLWSAEGRQRSSVFR